jgi:hypothetical protein
MVSYAVVATSLAAIVFLYYTRADSDDVSINKDL